MEGWLQHLSGDRYDVCSAVMQPVSLNLGPVEAMAESGRWTENMVRLLETHHSYIGSHRFVDLRHFKDGVERKRNNAVLGEVQVPTENTQKTEPRLSRSLYPSERTQMMAGSSNGIFRLSRRT